MRLALLERRDTIIGKNNYRRHFWRNMKGHGNEYGMNKIIFIYIFNHEK